MILIKIVYNIIEKDLKCYILSTLSSYNNDYLIDVVKIN